MTNLSPQTIPDYDNLTASQQRRHTTRPDCRDARRTVQDL